MVAEAGEPGSFLSLPGVFKNCRDVAAELLSDPLTCLVDRVDKRATIRCLPESSSTIDNLRAGTLSQVADDGGLDVHCRRR